jgi:gamma-glutamyltranspeptidase / glutathione hydrolase
MLKKLIWLFLLWVLLFSVSGSSHSFETCEENDLTPSPAVGFKGMVSSAHPLATESGLEILKRGGNAFDAAVTVASVLNVVEPMMSGIGGYGTILIYDAARGKVRYLDSSGKIPQAVDSDVFRPPTPGYRENRKGPKSVSIPGNVNAWEALSKEYGRLKWKDLFYPAIELASEGFEISDNTAGMIASAFSSFPEWAKEFYGKNRQPLKSGERLIQKDLTESFRKIAEEGAEAVYGGTLGKAIDAAMKESGGFLSLDDLVKDKAEWWEPIHIEYRGFQVYAASPPSTAFPSLIRLGIMSLFDNKRLGHNSVDYLHYFAEVTKHAFWCRLAYAGDPDIDPPPLENLLSKKYWERQKNKIDPNRVIPFVPPETIIKEGKNTTHFVVADRWGNIVSATQTLGNAFGSRVMPKGTGIWLNNSLAYCTFEPKGNPMDAHAGHRKLSGDCPTIILKQGRPWAALGTPGGHTIGQTVPQIIMNLIDFDMNIQEAITAPRISFVEPDLIFVEGRIPEQVRSLLKAKGHNIKVTKGLGNAHGLILEYDDEGRLIRFLGGADVRGQGQALGY